MRLHLSTESHFRFCTLISLFLTCFYFIVYIQLQCTWQNMYNKALAIKIASSVDMALHFITTYIPTSLFPLQDSKEPPDCRLSESFTSSGCTLGVDLRRGRRRFSGNLQLPPLSWRQTERSRSPDDEIMARPTTLPFITPPRIDITPVDPEWWVRVNQLLSLLLNFNFRNLIYYKRCE